MSDEGLNRAAVLLMAVGAEHAAEVLKLLAPREVQKIGQAMARLKDISREQIEQTLESFRTEAEERTTLGVGSDDYVRNILTRALGDEKASGIIERILQGGDTSGIEGLKWMDSPSVAELIRNEHPQIIATILVHLDRDQAAEILSLMADRVRNDVMLRIATLEGIQPTALRELNDVLNKLLSGSSNLKKAPMGGVRAAAEILNFLGSNIEGPVVESIREQDAELAQKILDQMFVFDNLVDLDDRAIQLLLREVQSDALVVALRGAADALKEKIFKNMSQRAAEMLQEELESRGPVRLSEVEAQQKEILKVVRKLSDEGQLALGGKNEEAYV